MYVLYLTSEIGAPFLNADGFGISWHTDERGNFNPFPVSDQQQSGLQAPEAQQSPVPLPGRAIKTDGPLIPFVRGLHPAIYKTTIAKPWVLMDFIAQPFIFFFPFRLNDPVFLSLCANVSSRTIFAHVRAAGAPPVATTNNHPFVFGRHSFMHNGGIANFDEVVS